LIVRFTRQLNSWRLSSALAALSFSTFGMLASCASDRSVGNETPDAAADGSESPGSLDDAGDGEAAPPSRDAARSDAGPLPVACTANPCVTSLTTTLAAWLDEGFCALLHDGTVVCWGQNQSGQLGRGDALGIRDSAIPARVGGLSDIVALGHSCAIDKSGATWCWGIGPYLQDEFQATTKHTTPVKLPIPAVTKIDLNVYQGLATACAQVDAGVVCWGMNRNGQLAEPEIGVDREVPLPPSAIAIPQGAPLQDLVVGNATFLLRTDGTLLSWGANPPLGRISSLFPDPYPKPVALTGVSSIDVGGDNACAVAQGIAYCWGTSQSTGNVLSRALPEPIPMPEPVVQIATSRTREPATPHRGCACGLSGDVYCWGNNEFGQAGDGTKDFAFAPVKVTGLPGPAAQVKTLPAASCAVLTSGKVYCWGDNANGQLGSGPIKEPSLVPREVVLP
jgi:alpha-tubulin suppressor-like RCC1 family protein